MSYTDPNDPLRRDPVDPVHRDPVDRHVEKEYVQTSSDSSVSWFIVGALVIAAGVLAYMYFGNSGDTTAANPPAIEEQGRASTPAAPAEPAMPAEPAPAAPAPVEPAPPTPPAPPAP